jgi:hypothetical protein
MTPWTRPRRDEGEGSAWAAALDCQVELVAICEGAEGMSFIETAVRSAESDAKWTRLITVRQVANVRNCPPE